MSLDKKLQEDSELILKASFTNVKLEQDLKQKRQDLILSCAIGGDAAADLQEKLRRECHDLLDLIIDNETALVANIVGAFKKNIGK